jgi:dienelactone hydrolase
MRRSALALAGIAVLTPLAACGDDAGAPATTPATTPAPATTVPPTTAATTVPPTTTTGPPTTPATTVPALDPAQAYVEPGPYPVGVLTLTLPTGNAVEVWYPAAEGTTGQVSYDVRDFLPDELRMLLTGDLPAVFTIDGARDALAARGRFPLVLFSHGFSGIRSQSSFLTSHLASWGMIVAAPDHPSRDLRAATTFQTGQGTDPVADLLATLDLMDSENSTAGSPLAGRIDLDRIGALGHSAGGGTILGATSASDRIDGYVSMASGRLQDPEQPLPQRPSFFLAGTVDQVVPWTTRTAAAYDAAPAPSLLWVIDGVGHNGFDDFCTLGGGTGIIGLAEQSGLGSFFDAAPDFRRLGEDGCVPPAVPVTEAWPIIRHAVTSWFRHLFGIDAEPVGLGVDVASAYPLIVTIESK